MTVEKNCEEAVLKATERFKRLDVLIPNAGVLAIGVLETHSITEYDRVMDINCRSIVVLMKFCIPHLIESKGNIVVVSSICGLRAVSCQKVLLFKLHFVTYLVGLFFKFPNTAYYNMSKAAVDQLTRSAALELAPKGVRVNAVNPGTIATECQKRAGMTGDFYNQYMEHSKTTHPLGRIGTAEEVAKAIAFLASDDASFITGVTLPVDGGRTVACPR